MMIVEGGLSDLILQIWEPRDTVYKLRAFPQIFAIVLSYWIPKEIEYQVSLSVGL